MYFFPTDSVSIAQAASEVGIAVSQITRNLRIIELQNVLDWKII